MRIWNILNQEAKKVGWNSGVVSSLRSALETVFSEYFQNGVDQKDLYQ